MVFGERQKNVLCTQKLKETETGQGIIQQFLDMASDYKEEEFQDLQKQVINNHYWTQEEKMLLVYFKESLDMDWEQINAEKLPHRSITACKAKFKQIIKGEDTPANTPRLSMSNISKSIGNKLIKCVTPSATPVKTKKKDLVTINEEVEEDSLDDDELLLQEEEEEPLLGGVEEEEEVEEENVIDNENEEGEVQEEMEQQIEEEEEFETKEAEKNDAFGFDIFLYGLLIPTILLLIFTAVIVLMPKENLGFNTTLQNYRNFVLETIEKVEKTIQESFK